MPKFIKQLASLTKQGLVLFVVMSVYIAYFYASGNLWLNSTALLLILSAYLTASGAHVFNQIIELKYDAKMPRTKSRPLVTGYFTIKFAYILGSILTLLGILLAAIINWQTALIIALSAVVYLAVYTPLKRISYWNTWLGAIAGSLPPLAAWSAVRGSIELEGFYIPLIIYFWQITHFLALAWKYRNQYREAGYKMIVSIDETGNYTSFLMFIHAILLIFITVLPYIFNITPFSYLVVALILGGWILALILQFQKYKNIKSATKIFVHCNGYLLGIFAALIIYAWS